MTTFTGIASWVTRLDEAPRVKAARFGDGYVQRSGFGMNLTPQKWTVNFATKTDAEAATILDFFRTQAGVDPFDWLTPEGETKSFICSKWPQTWESYGSNVITVEFVEDYSSTFSGFGITGGKYETTVSITSPTIAVYTSGDSVSYTALAVCDAPFSGGPFTYSWSLDDSTTDTGASISKIWGTNGSHLASVLATNSATGQIVGTSISVFVGAWTNRTNSGSAQWYGEASSADGTRLAACVNLGYIKTSADSGATWTQRTSAGSKEWWGIASSADGQKLVAVANIDDAYLSTDGGATWNTYATGLGVGGKNVASSSDGTKLVIVGNYGQMVVSSDSGLTWGNLYEAPETNFYAVASSADGARLAACNHNLTNGWIYTSSDSGASWAISGAPANQWTDVALSSDGLTMVACEYSGYISTSIDGGTTWVERTSSGSRLWYGVHIADDASIISACVYNGYVYRSYDLGVTWVEDTGPGARAWQGLTGSSDGAQLLLVDLGTTLWTFNGV